MADFAKIIKDHGGDISEEAINAIASAIKTAVGNEYVEKERYKSKLTEIDSLKEQVQTADDKATTAQKWEEKYNSLKEKYDSFKTETEAAKTKAAKETAYRKLLKEIGVSDKRIDTVMKVTDIAGIELDDKGAIKDSDKMKDSAKQEWADFITTKHEVGAETSNPPAGNNGTAGAGTSRAAQLAAKYHENLYGKTES